MPIKNCQIGKNEGPPNILTLSPKDLQKHIQYVANSVYKQLGGKIPEETIYDSLIGLACKEKKKQRKYLSIKNSPKLQSLLHTRIADIPNSELTTRTKQGFDDLGLLYIGDICVHTPKELRKFPGIGPQSIKDFQRYISKIGLVLGIGPDIWDFRKEVSKTRKATKVIKVANVGILDLLNGGVNEK